MYANLSPVIQELVHNEEVSWCETFRQIIHKNKKTTIKANLMTLRMMLKSYFRSFVPFI